MKNFTLIILILPLFMVIQSCNDSDEIYEIIGTNPNEGGDNGDGGDGTTEGENTLKTFTNNVVTTTESFGMSIDQEVNTFMEFGQDASLLQLIITSSMTNPITGQPEEFTSIGQINYEGDLLTSLVYGMAGQEATISYTYNSDGKLESITTNGSDVTQVIDISYPSENQIIAVNSNNGIEVNTVVFNFNNNLLSNVECTITSNNKVLTENYTYSNGNLISASYSFDGQTLPTINYTYDNKNAPLYNVVYNGTAYNSPIPFANYGSIDAESDISQIYFEASKVLSDYCVNNPKEFYYFDPMTNATTYSVISYTYNGDNYPITKSVQNEVEIDLGGMSSTITLDALYTYEYF